MQIVFLDIDGVLTDGAVYVDELGKETKRILFEDINAIFDLKRAGLKFGFITGENNTFCDYLDKRFSPNIFLRGCKDKLSSLKKLNLNMVLIKLMYVMSVTHKVTSNYSSMWDLALPRRTRQLR